MTPADLWTWLENLPLSMYISESWWFPFLESIHILTATFIVGSILMVDLRLMGLAARTHPVSRITREILPWTWGASFVSMMTGVALFAGRANHYVENRAFQVKIALLVLAAINMTIFHLVTARGIVQWDTTARTTPASRAAGVCSLALWVGIMLAGRWIGHLS
jgi:uncharacterized membrane protein